MDFFFALLPILTLIILLGVCKLSGDKSSLIALLVTLPIALWYCHLSLIDVTNAFLIGLIKAFIPILFVILMAMYSYNLLLHTKFIEVLKQQFASISTDRSIQVLLITWGFGGLLEGMAGFGTAVAIPAAILISLGFKPALAALVSLIANSVATGFAAVGVPIITLGVETGANADLLAILVVKQLSALMFIVPLILTILVEPKIKLLPKNLLLSFIVGGVSLITQYLAARYLGVQTPAILGSLASIIVLIIIGKLSHRETSKVVAHRHNIKNSIKAWSIYGLIMLLILLTSPIVPPIHGFLANKITTSFVFSIQDANKTIVIDWLTQAGLLLFIGSFIGGRIQGASIKNLFGILLSTIMQLRKTAITVVCLIACSSIMESAGLIYQLAVSLALAIGTSYPLIAPFIGALGTFITGSDTSSNILFGKLQWEVASQIGVDQTWLAAANTAGATGGKIISPQSIAVACSVCKTEGEEGRFLKRAFPFALVYVIAVSLIVYFAIGSAVI
ncbi:MAG: L-lactate permease [Bacteroidales bacterium]